MIKTIDEELTPRLLKEYHSLLKSNTIDSERGFAGVYKKIPNKLRGVDIETSCRNIRKMSNKIKWEVK